MNIQDAMRKTGKALRDEQPDYLRYVTEKGGLFQWLRNDGQYELLSYSEGIECNWQPCHEVKEITPEKAGELWNRGVNKYLTFGDSRHLRMFKQDGGEYSLDEFIPSGPVHGQGGWTRLFPPVLTEEEMKAEIREIFNPSNTERMLDEDEVDVICDMLQEEVQFYGPEGVKNNAGVIYQIAEVLCKATKETS